jgi:hypothetical protein
LSSGTEESFQHEEPPPRRPSQDERGPRRPGDYDDYDDFRRPRYREPERGTMILVFGILSIVVCGIFGPIAWVMGNTDLDKMQRGEMDPAGQGSTQAGKVCGIIGTALLILYVVVFCAYILIVAAVLSRVH